MTDKLTRIALFISFVVIAGLLLRPAMTQPAQLQQAAQTQPVMVVDNATLYVLSGDKISVYYWDGPATAKLKPQIGKLKLMQTVNIKPAENP